MTHLVILLLAVKPFTLDSSDVQNIRVTQGVHKVLKFILLRQSVWIENVFEVSTAFLSPV